MVYPADDPNWVENYRIPPDPAACVCAGAPVLPTLIKYGFVGATDSLAPRFAVYEEGGGCRVGSGGGTFCGAGCAPVLVPGWLPEGAPDLRSRYFDQSDLDVPAGATIGRVSVVTDTGGGFAYAELLSFVAGATACGEGAAEYVGAWWPWDETEGSRCVAEALTGWRPSPWVAVFRQRP